MAGTIDRRTLLRGGLLVGAGAVGGGLTGGLVGTATADAAGGSATEPYWGAHQSGITTGTQRHTMLAAFDLTGSRDDLARLLQAWTGLGASLTRAESVTIPIASPGAGASADAYADATGGSTTDDSFEAYGLGANRLTLTVGVGRSLFLTPAGDDRLGLADRLPAALVDLPHFGGDQLVSADSGGDIYLQACADDPQVVFHAVRSLARVAPDVASLRWTQLGFSPDDADGTPRNLMGFKDGTMDSNLHPPADPAATLWAGAEGPAWMEGGSYLVYRRIRMTLEHWDRLAAPLQQQVIGRRKLDGSPLGTSPTGGRGELAPVDLTKLPADSHVRLAHPDSNGGATMLRRAFSYTNGTTQFVERWPPWRQALEYDAGLLFLAYQSDPRRAFVPVFTRLSGSDALNQFTTHTASAVFAVPPGASGPGDWVGRRLLA